MVPQYIVFVYERRVWKALTVCKVYTHLTNLRVFCTSKAATSPIVVGKLAAHTPSLFSVFSSVPVATMSGGAHFKMRKQTQHYTVQYYTVKSHDMG